LGGCGALLGALWLLLLLLVLMTDTLLLLWVLFVGAALGCPFLL